MNILSICSEPSIMEVMRIIVLFINIIKVVVPIILIISLMIKFAGAVTKNDQDLLNKAAKTAIPSAIAAVLIFLVPTFVDIVVKATFPNSDYSKCISGISKESIEEAYNKKMDELIKVATTSLTNVDYSNAYSYLSNIKDKDKKQKYQEILSVLNERLNQKNKSETTKKNSNEYANVNYSNFKWTTYENNKGPANKYYSNILPYAVWAPEDVNDLNGVSLPLIVWLHGAGELSYQKGMNLKKFINVGFLKSVGDWKNTGLLDIPAIIVAPQASGKWAISADTRDKNIDSIKALIDYSKEKYNIDLNNVMLMGHSMGGDGVVHVSYEMQKKYSYDYFNKLVIMSGTNDLKYPSNDKESGLAYFKNKEIRGYSENGNCKPFFEWTGKLDNYISMKGTSHGNVPKVALELDENKDGISDLVYWLFGEKANTKKKQESITQQDSSDDSEGGSSGSDGSYVVPTANPITKYVDVNSVNSKIASAVKSHGLYTRGAVVAAATTLINTLDASGYYIPYQLGGMYHRDGKWGVNPNWGTVITHNGKQVLSGLDCRNFVNWAFQQAGLCLIRGYGSEGSTSETSYDNKYDDLTDGRPGDVIDHARHIMLIVSNNGDGYTVAEANGVGRVRLYNITIASMQSFGYQVYNMDGIYDNTAVSCSQSSPYNACDMSCHIDSSKFPSYY